MLWNKWNCKLFPRIWTLCQLRLPQKEIQTPVQNKMHVIVSFVPISHSYYLNDRAVFKWLSKGNTWLRLLRLVIGLKDSRQFFNQWESKTKPIASCTRDLSRASSELHVTAGNCDWRCLLQLWLVGVIALVLVFRQSLENRSNKGITWLFEGILFICARVVSFAARSRSARAANDTTRAQINNIPEKSHVIIIIINKQCQMISRMRGLIIQAKWITNSKSLQIIM